MLNLFGVLMLLFQTEIKKEQMVIPMKFLSL